MMSLACHDDICRMIHQKGISLELIRIAIDACKCCIKHRNNSINSIDGNEVVITIDKDIEAVFNDDVKATKLGVFFMKSTSNSIDIKKGNVVTDKYQNAMEKWCSKSKSDKIGIVLH